MLGLHILLAFELDGVEALAGDATAEGMSAELANSWTATSPIGEPV